MTEWQHAHFIAGKDVFTPSTWRRFTVFSQSQIIPLGCHPFLKQRGFLRGDVDVHLRERVDEPTTHIRQQALRKSRQACDRETALEILDRLRRIVDAFEPVIGGFYLLPLCQATCRPC